MREPLPSTSVQHGPTLQRGGTPHTRPLRRSASLKLFSLRALEAQLGKHSVAVRSKRNAATINTDTPRVFPQNVTLTAPLCWPTVFTYLQAHHLRLEIRFQPQCGHRQVGVITAL